MENFIPFSGILTTIQDFLVDASGQGLGCYKLMTVVNSNGDLVNFVVSPDTYFVDLQMVNMGDRVTGFYDANAPAPLIYPPQYNAIVMVKDSPYYFVKVDFFDNQLISSDNMLQLRIAPFTQIILQNGQDFNRVPVNNNLIVMYGATTKSIPAQTVPYKIIVMCN